VPFTSNLVAIATILGIKFAAKVLQMFEIHKNFDKKVKFICVFLSKGLLFAQTDIVVNMATIHLIRTNKERNAVRGTATIPMGKDSILCATLENADFIIPEGTYQLVNTMSPRFKKILPLLVNVPGRSGIRGSEKVVESVRKGAFFFRATTRVPNARPR